MSRYTGYVTRGRKNPLHYGLPWRLHEVRYEVGLTVHEMGALAGLSNSVVSYIENGRVPLLDSVERIALAVGVSPCWLAFGADGAGRFRQKIARTAERSRLSETPHPIKGATVMLGSKDAPTRCQYARMRLGLTRIALGEAAGTSGVTVGAFETGRNRPRLDLVERLAMALDVAPCWLAFGVGPGPELDPGP